MAVPAQKNPGLAPGACSVSLTKNEGGVLLSIVGQITESSAFGALLNNPAELFGSKLLLIDLGKVERINSNGVRGWLIFLETLQTKTSIAFTAVSEAIIEQALLTLSLLGRKGTPVQSFEIPYNCPKCRTRWTRMMATRSVDRKGYTFTPPAASCPVCASPGQFDAMEDEYFTFIKRSAE